MTARSSSTGNETDFIEMFADEVRAKLFRARTRRSIFCASRVFAMKVLTTACRAARRRQHGSSVLSWMIRMSPRSRSRRTTCRAERSGGEVLTLMTP